MKTTHTIAIDTGDRCKAPPIDLTYKATPIGNGKQARLEGRVLLQPTIDLGRYRCKALIDYVELRVQTAQATQFRYVQKRIETALKTRRPFVKPLGKEKNAATSFMVRLQEPSISNLFAVQAVLQRQFGLTLEPRINAIEVSVDLYSRSGSDADRQRLVAVMQRAYWPKCDVWSDKNERPRFIFGNAGCAQTKFLMPTVHRDPETLLTRALFKPSLIAKFRTDATYYIGAQASDHQIKIQNKISDQRTGTSAIQLNREECRARIEVTLRGNALTKHGIRTLDDLSRFNFNTLQGDYFHFAHPTLPWKSKQPMLQRINEYQNESRAVAFLRGGILPLEQLAPLRVQWFRERPSSLQGRSRRQVMLDHLKAIGQKPPRIKRGRGRMGHTVSYTELNTLVHDALRELSRKEARRLRKFS